MAIFLREPGYDRLIRRLAAARDAAIGTPTLAETAVALLARLGSDPRQRLARFLAKFGMVVLPFETAHWRRALDGYRRFGKGRHPAALNFGDCLTYATAKIARRPVLCVGEDFTQTDLEIA